MSTKPKAPRRFDYCIGLILLEEGGLSDHPKDPGGHTKYGISKRSHPDVDIANLTLSEAQTIYFIEYWAPIHGDLLPIGLDLLMLDCAINQGVKTAIRLLQEALRVPVDGIIGSRTEEAAHAEGPDIMGRFCALRAWRYEINKNEDVFGKGWFLRLFRMYNTAMRDTFMQMIGRA